MRNWQENVILVVGIFALFFLVGLIVFDRPSQKRATTQDVRIDAAPLTVHLARSALCADPRATLATLDPDTMVMQCWQETMRPFINLQSNDRITITRRGEEWTLDARTRTLEQTFRPKPEAMNNVMRKISLINES